MYKPCPASAKLCGARHPLPKPYLNDRVRRTRDHAMRHHGPCNWLDIEVHRLFPESTYSNGLDLLPVVPSSARVSFPGNLDLRRTHDEAQTVCGRADPRDPEGAGGRRDRQGRVPAPRHQRADVISLEGEVRRDVGERCEAAEAA